jgi:hypothetical protein
MLVLFTDVIIMLKSMKMTLAGHVRYMEETENGYMYDMSQSPRKQGPNRET